MGADGPRWHLRASLGGRVWAGRATIVCVPTPDFVLVVTAGNYDTEDQRLIADARPTEEIKRRVKAQYETLDPVRLLSDIRAGQRRLVEIADAPEVAFAIEQPTLEQFLSGLRTAWQDREVRPTARRKAPARKTKRNTPDPFRLVAVDLRAWFEAEPWRTSGELFDRLQTEYPGAYPDGQIRTLQRRIKDWRRERPS